MRTATHYIHRRKSRFYRYIPALEDLSPNLVLSEGFSSDSYYNLVNEAMTARIFIRNRAATGKLDTGGF